MSDAAFTVADLRPVDLFDDLDDDQLAQWAAVARPYDAAPGDVLVEQGESPPGVLLLLEGIVQTVLARGRADRACRPPEGADVDRRRSPC